MSKLKETREEYAAKLKAITADRDKMIEEKVQAYRAALEMTTPIDKDAVEKLQKVIDALDEVIAIEEPVVEEKAEDVVEEVVKEVVEEQIEVQPIQEVEEPICIECEPICAEPLAPQMRTIAEAECDVTVLQRPGMAVINEPARD